MNIEKLKNDHHSILESVTELRKLIQAGVSENAIVIAKMIVSMSSAIKLHLAAEDQALYPVIVNSADPATSEIGKKFQAEVGGIAAAYMEFAGMWNLSDKVAENPGGFREHANSIFKALHQRIQLENRELYPLVERA